jgi:demethoxyubiquinone hydroxylase (CLK1/Coq7/Cat5 family)
MKRHTVILPFLLPRLSDAAAAQLVALLNALLTGIEHHYADQIQRYHQRQRELSRYPPVPPSSPADSPF